jgi:tRNA/rRNA methyltransferase
MLLPQKVDLACKILLAAQAMPGSGTDKTKRWVETPAPIVILVEPQLGDNIGATARAMANFGLSRLRLIKPRDGWPNRRAYIAASGADRILDQAVLFDTIEAAIADLTLVLATTARTHDQAKPVIGPDQAARIMAARIASGENAGVLFGRERYGLENTEIALTDSIVTFPVNPAFASLNLAQAVLVIAYEWFKLASGGTLPFSMPRKSEPAAKEQLLAFFENLERELRKVEFFRPPEKHETMTTNLRNIFNRMQPTRQDIQTLNGVVMAIAEGRKGPASGGVLDGEEAEMLRALLAEHPQASAPSARAPVRGLARFLRRNPTKAERRLWEALTKDRRFASMGFKRQTPVGRHMTDLVSFSLRFVVDIAPADETEAARNARDERRTWLLDRGYRVLEIGAGEIEADTDSVLDRIKQSISRP